MAPGLLPEWDKLALNVKKPQTQDQLYSAEAKYVKYISGLWNSHC